MQALPATKLTVSAHMVSPPLVVADRTNTIRSSGAGTGGTGTGSMRKRILPDPLALDDLTMECTEPAMSTAATVSSTTTMVHSGARSALLSPEPQKGLENDRDTIWQVVVGLDRLVLETRKDQQLLAAEIEDLMDILTRTERIERWISRIEIIAENIRESPQQYLQLERIYRSLEKEWMERLQKFQSTVGLLLIRWDQCGYLPVDDYDMALNKLFELAGSAAIELTYWKIEAPLCLSNECLASLSAKLTSLDQNYYTRQARVRAMEHVLGLIYQDFGTAMEQRVQFRNEATVKYAAELGRELKSLQLELAARKLYQNGEHWTTLQAVWDSCMVSEQERVAFRDAIEQSEFPFIDKMERVRSEIETCRTRFSRSGQVYKLMMTRSSHIEKMIAFEQTAKDPKRLFQSSFQLNEEEKFRRRAYPTLLKLESTLMDAIEKFEQERGESFMYEGVLYMDTLQTEINSRHVNETVFAKFTPVIAAPTRSQTIQIMGRAISPIPSQPSSRPSSISRASTTSSTRSQESYSRRSLTLPVQGSGSPSNKDSRGSTTVDTESQSLQAFRHQRELSSTSTASAHTLKSKSSSSSLSSLSAVSTPASTTASATNTPPTERSPTTSYFNASASSRSCSGATPSLIESSVKQDPKSQKVDRRSFPTILMTPPGSPATARVPVTRSSTSAQGATPSRFVF
ncbi:hypothetical protein BGZ83_007500 [Gryganskiella cystojenkinii]|nr:hypothetical protein BGZ83_007500 [Gryganskiella cystojenkinii]